MQEKEQKEALEKEGTLDKKEAQKDMTNVPVKDSKPVSQDAQEITENKTDKSGQIEKDAGSVGAEVKPTDVEAGSADAMSQPGESEPEKTLADYVERQDVTGLAKYFEEKEPIDIAQEATELSDDDIIILPQLLSDDNLAALLEESDDEQRIRIARVLDNRRLLLAFHFMQKDDIVDMLGDFPIGRRKDVINLMKKDDRKIITDLLKYPEESAGGIMTTGYLALKENLTVEQGLDTIREVGPKTEHLDVIYITDQHRKLVGFVPLRDLLSTPRQTIIKDIMDTHVISVSPETDQEEAARLVSRYDLKSLPVVSRGMILGIITVDDIIDVIVDEADEDILKMGGVNREESLTTPMWESVKMRLPWLLINLLTAFLASSVVKIFEDTISQVVALSAIMTIISGMGGNAGTQTMSIVVRHLAKENIDSKAFWKDFGKELMIGLIDGAINGFITGIVVVLMYHNAFLLVIVLMSMIGNLLVAGIFGLAVPVLLNKCHADPAIASSIFLTTATDCLGFFIFLGLAKLFMPLLL